MAKKTVKKAKKKAKRKQKASSAPKGMRGLGKKLVIVESPAKAGTINKYLGDGYIVRASMGHVRDLPAKSMGVDLEKNFDPAYEPLLGRKKVLTELCKYAKNAPEIFLATDLDREGEAIAWHLAESLGVPENKFRRVIFNQITPSAIADAFKNPRSIDINMVNAQQARRILDRIVGYKVSPLLWKKVSPGLSAGRVQTVAVRLIVEREQEIDAFMPEEYWKIDAIFSADLSSASSLAKSWQQLLARVDERGVGPTKDVQRQFLTDNGAFRAELVAIEDARFKTDSSDRAIEVAKALGMDVSEIVRTEDTKAKGVAQNKISVVGLPANWPDYTIDAIKLKQTRSRPPAPFATASLQQAASAKMRYSASRTMRLAQQLYEGADVPGEGTVGLITYMRTDSRNLAPEAVKAVREMIKDKFGPEYVPDKPNRYSSAKRAQEAHEAIRPTDPTRTPSKLAGSLNDEQMKLYELIWKRFVACQMSPAVWNVTEVNIVADTDIGRAKFKAMGRTIHFKGYLAVTGMPKSGDQILPPLQESSKVAPGAINPTQHFTQPPPRYTEASLVKALEADGIGRPSTYASIIKTIQDRSYAKQIDRTFRPTHLGNVVTEKLVKHFPKVFDVRFTADMEDQLDQVEEAKADWVKVLRAFYDPFASQLEKAAEDMVHAKAESEPSEYICPECSKPMAYRFSKTGRYLSCTGYPDCKQTCPVDDDGKKIEKVTADLACPICSKAMTLRKGRFGPFLSCPDYPECKGVVNLDKKGFIKHPTSPPLLVDLKCEKCDGQMNLRRSKRGPWLSCSKFPKCRGRTGWAGLDEKIKADLDKKLLQHEADNPATVLYHLDGSRIEKDEAPKPIEPTEPTKE